MECIDLCQLDIVGGASRSSVRWYDSHNLSLPNTARRGICLGVGCTSHDEDDEQDTKLSRGYQRVREWKSTGILTGTPIATPAIVPVFGLVEDEL